MNAGAVRLAVFASVIWLHGPACVCAGDEAATLGAARQAEKEKDFEKAQQFYRQVLAADRKQAQAWSGLGRALEKSGKAEEAVKTLEEGVKAVPQDAGLYRALGGLYLGQGEVQKATNVILEAAARDPEYAKDLQAALPGLFKEPAKLEQVVVFLGKLRKAGKNVGSVSALAVSLLHRAGRDGEAEAFAAKAVEEHPGQSELYYLWAGQLGGMGKLEEAQDAFQKGLERCPTAALCYGAGFCAYQQSNAVRAEKLFNQTLEKEPGHARAYVGLGWICRDRQDPMGARIAFQKALDLAPTDPAVVAAAGEYYRQKVLQKDEPRVRTFTYDYESLVEGVGTPPGQEASLRHTSVGDGRLTRLPLWDGLWQDVLEFTRHDEKLSCNGKEVMAMGTLPTRMEVVTRGLSMGGRRFIGRPQTDPWLYVLPTLPKAAAELQKDFAWQEERLVCQPFAPQPPVMMTVTYTVKEKGADELAVEASGTTETTVAQEGLRPTLFRFVLTGKSTYTLEGELRDYSRRLDVAAERGGRPVGKGRDVEKLTLH